ncbi:hypothetical protein PAAG_08408 [Paracoccidioides lutzii Pb01]|uniref:Mitochondrial fission process protein 1 n=1 Tax=Paracoccidioides lutzii (strain ATCC MYA-826 / Pb01) TaxID=502779 RepID=C1HCB7_PARBA|nr:hypothetical protein PAAG_08408 [Paracoccidioides lutzii Pb01]EEH38681.1 hypothetical protein PAAG_08408 [Paracoccidioides lutzii Pb01]
MAWGISKKPQTDDNGDNPSHKQSPEGLSPPHLKLNRELQKLVNREEELLDKVYDGYAADSTDTKYRYAAYTNRIRTILLSAHRYVAYTSDIGESFRPVAHPWLVRFAYGISWAYILGDVANEGYKAYLRNRLRPRPWPEDLAIDAVAGRKLEHQQEATLTSTASKAHPMPWPDPEGDILVPWLTTKIPLSEEYRAVMAERAVFQVIASMGLPALTIHSVVKYSGRALKGAKITLVRTWVPIGLGLAVVPFLPYMFDKPVEHGVQGAFRSAFRVIEGEKAVSQPAEESQTSSAILSNLKRYQEQKKHQNEPKKPEMEKGD